MEPTIDGRGEYIIVDRLASVFGWFRHGDVVIAKNPVDPGMIVCKRIVGYVRAGTAPRPPLAAALVSRRAPDDVVRDGRMEGDVVLVPPQPSPSGAAGPGGSKDDRLVTVPRGHVWLQGDNQSISRDSREYGPVPLALLRGRAMCAVRPDGEESRNHYGDRAHPPARRTDARARCAARCQVPPCAR